MKKINILKVKWTIYALFDPRDNKPFYIGQTQHPETREQQHRKNSSCGIKHVKKIKELRDAGVEFVFWKLNEASTLEEALMLERGYISQAKNMKLELSNSDQSISKAHSTFSSVSYGKKKKTKTFLQKRDVTISNEDEKRIKALGVDVIELYMKMRAEIDKG